ncbi:PQQ-binding-like beta-propeller repeat protein [Halosolutus amylolyticus]|uniref:PQQ-binding-like beta-propeller repeat protein n=1 Tax=Halosolutus amylolyticus TaxID=2932267 RepID=A0ABD5PKN2_9EURY|nr:PQQ-binding-like beta-propeller repeat protein [Halosolutus amylolyticus]
MISAVGAGCLSALGGDDDPDGTGEGDAADDGPADDEDDDGAADSTSLGWPSFQGSPGNTGVAGPVDAPTTEPTERWDASLPGAVTDQVAIVDGTVYACSDAGTVHAIDVASGDEQWSTTVDEDGGQSQCPCVVGDRLVLGTESGSLVALDREDGTERWTTALPGPVSGPTAAGGTVYVGTREDPVCRAVDASSGDVRWTFDPDPAVDVVDYPAVTDDLVYVGAEDTSVLDGRLYALDRATGTERWSHEGARMQPPTVAGEHVAAPSLQVTIYDHAGGERGGFGFAGHVLSSPAATADAYFVGSTGGRLAAMRRRESGTHWNVDVGRRPVSAPAITDDAVYVTSGGPVLQAIDRDRGDERWSRSLDGEFASGPAVAGDVVVVGTDTGRLVAFE